MEGLAFLDMQVYHSTERGLLDTFSFARVSSSTETHWLQYSFRDTTPFLSLTGRGVYFSESYTLLLHNYGLSLLLFPSNRFFILPLRVELTMVRSAGFIILRSWVYLATVRSETFITLPSRVQLTTILSEGFVNFRMRVYPGTIRSEGFIILPSRI